MDVALEPALSVTLPMSSPGWSTDRGARDDGFGNTKAHGPHRHGPHQDYQVTGVAR